jgi:hypothetical protein
MRKIMRATLHHDAANTYYGQWNLEIATICWRKSPSIARNGAAADVKFGAVWARRLDFPGNRVPACE